MFGNMKIGTRMMAGFCLVIVLTGGIGVFSWLELGWISGQTRDLYDHPHTVSVTIGRATVDLLKADRAFRNAMLTEDDLRFKGYAEDSDMRLFEFGRSLAIVRERYLGPSRDLDDVETAVGQWKERRDSLFELVRSGRKPEALAQMIGDNVITMSVVDSEVNDVFVYATKKASAFLQGAEDAMRLAMIVLAVLVVANAALSLAIALLTARSVTRPLKAVVEAANRMAEGDLATDIEVRRKDETGLLAEAFRNMMRRTGDIVKRLAESTQTLTSSSEQLSAASTQLVGSSSQIVAAVEETSASIEEIKEIAQNTDGKARAVADKAQAAVSISQDGHQAVDGTVARMEHIRDQMASLGDIILRLSGHGQAIHEIIEAVEDLADQSNMLAVNAAIEAAKAGEEGKGFAVVAQEIRALADQSKQATTKVRAIVQDIQKSTNAAVLATEKGAKVVEEGVRQSMHAGESIAKLLGSIDDTAQAGTVIAASAREQIVGMDQIMTAVRQVKTAVTQNVTAAQELQKTARYLADMGRGLTDIVSRFRT